ncbi:MAG: putative Na+/H+ antiporter [Deltaproteobacteria bacterium]|nr:putative Na+/H+ antiporter [Deltaproteobacteria bacterium]
MSPTMIQILSTVFFACAIVHTFTAQKILQFSHHFKTGSVRYQFFHILGEVEVSFAVWAGVFIFSSSLVSSPFQVVGSLEKLNFTEPLFVFVMMSIAATRPVLEFAQSVIEFFSKMIPLSRPISFYLSLMIFGPLLGSLITEPAAMAVTALLLKRDFFDREVSTRFKYISIAVLFVNISVGGVLTSFAAPPVLMVAKHWNWDSLFMLNHFGWKATLIVGINAIFASLILRDEISKIRPTQKFSKEKTSLILQFIYLFFIFSVVVMAHHAVAFVGVFILFLGAHFITAKYQESLRLKESFLVALFLAGLVVLGSDQAWWLQPVLSKLNAFSLFIGASALTAITDNAALTYLGARVENVSELFKYALVAGAVAGGGLTVIANAPNPAGYSILKSSFGDEGVSAGKLFCYALAPTFVAIFCFWFL